MKAWQKDQILFQILNSLQMFSALQIYVNASVLFIPGYHFLIVYFSFSSYFPNKISFSDKEKTMSGTITTRNKEKMIQKERSRHDIQKLTTVKGRLDIPDVYSHLTTM